MKFMRTIGAVILGLLITGISALSQDMRASAPIDPASWYTKLRAFSATVHTIINPDSDREPIESQSKWALLEGKIRVESDDTDQFEKAVSKWEIFKKIGDNERSALLQNVGMLSHSVTISDTLTSTDCFLYPSLKAYYCSPPMPDKKQEPTKKQYTETNKINLGNEIVDGHPCTKYKFTRTSDSGATTEITLWEANDLNGFSIKSEALSSLGSSSRTQFKDINTAKPDPALFIPPSDYKRYDTQIELLNDSHNKPKAK